MSSTQSNFAPRGMVIRSAITPKIFTFAAVAPGSPELPILTTYKNGVLGLGNVTSSMIASGSYTFNQKKLQASVKQGGQHNITGLTRDYLDLVGILVYGNPAYINNPVTKVFGVAQQIQLSTYSLENVCTNVANGTSFYSDGYPVMYILTQPIIIEFRNPTGQKQTVEILNAMEICCDSSGGGGGGNVPVPSPGCYGDYLYWDPTTSAWAVGSEQITIGCNAGQVNQGQYAVALGYQAGQTDQAGGSVAIGYLATANTNATNSVAIGTTATTNSANDVAIGNGAQVFNDNGIAIGFSAQANNAGGVVGSNGIAIGSTAKANDTAGSSAIAVGNSAEAKDESSIAIGNGAKANNTTGTKSIAIGEGANANTNSSIAIGESANANSGSSIAIGQSTSSTGSSSIVIGQSASTNQDRNVVIGDGATSTDGDVVVVGSSAQAGNTNVIAIGRQAVAQGAYSVVIGNQASTSVAANTSIAIGNSAQPTRAQSIVISACGTAQNSGTFGGNDGSIVLNASSGAMTISNPSLYVKPINNASNTNALLYNSSSGEVTYQPLSGLGLLAPFYGSFYQNAQFPSVSQFPVAWTIVPLSTGSGNMGATGGPTSCIQVPVNGGGIYRVFVRGNFMTIAGASGVLVQLCDSAGNALSGANGYSCQRVGAYGNGFTSQVSFDEMITVLNSGTIGVRIWSENPNTLILSTNGPTGGGGVIPMPLVVTLNRVA